MTILPEILVVAAIVFGLVAYAMGFVPGLRPAPPESGSVGLPDGPLAPAAVDQARFDVALRGYRMDEVDAVLDRLRDEIADRDAQLAALDPDRVAAEQEPPAVQQAPEGDTERNADEPWPT